MTHPEKINLLQKFAQAFNDHDIDTLMNCMTEDCIYDASAGLFEYGTRFEGQKAVRESFLNIFSVFPDAQWNNDIHFVDGDRGASQWYFTGTLADGKKVAVNGNDLFHFKGNKIHIKDSYRKNRTS